MLNCRTPRWLRLNVSTHVPFVLLMAACSVVKPDSDAGAPPSGAAGSAVKPRAGTSGSAGASGHKAVIDAGTTPDAGGFLDEDGGVLTPQQLFEGVPFDAIKGTAPAGCLDNSAGDDTTLVLQLDAKSTGIRISAPNGKITVNSTLCKAQSVHVIKVLGTMAVETVIIDGSAGSFPAALLADDGGIQVDLAAGKDTIAMMGSMDSDSFKLGTNGMNTIISSSGRFPKVSVQNQETLIVSSGPGDDRIEAGGGAGVGDPLAVSLKAWGGLGNDALSGGAKDDELHGGAGDDVFETAAAPDGADVYDGGSGIDTMSYDQRTASVSVKLNDAADDGEANERDNVQANVESLVGGSAADTFTGSIADNTFIGGPGNDVMNGGDGNDTFVEAAEFQGNDIMNGGAGSDLIDYSGRTLAMTISLCVGAPGCVAGACGCAANDGEEGETDTLANIENVSTGSGNDTITGSVADNTITAGAGNDVVNGLAGDDSLFGEEGNDQLIGGDGDDALYGGGGNDTLDAGAGQGDICVGSAHATLTGCELR
jgi:Ca2+-binding RTX toxin-like protein